MATTSKAFTKSPQEMPALVRSAQGKNIECEARFGKCAEAFTLLSECIKDGQIQPVGLSSIKISTVSHTGAEPEGTAEESMVSRRVVFRILKKGVAHTELPSKLFGLLEYMLITQNTVPTREKH